jgi:hypothetical protein
MEIKPIKYYREYFNKNEEYDYEYDIYDYISDSDYESDNED